MKLDEVNMKVDHFLTRNMMMLINFIYFQLNMIKFLENMKNPRTENPNWNRVWLMIFPIDWGLMIVSGAENKWPRAFSKWIKESWDWVSCSYLLKLESNSMKKCFQLSSNDCFSINGLYGSCMSGLLASNHPRSIQPSPPA